MQLINSISNSVGRAIDWTVDSSWGLSYWHSIPLWIGESGWNIACQIGRGAAWCWDSRVRLLITSMMIPAFIITPQKEESHFKSEDTLPPGSAIFCGFIMGSVGSWLWETRLVSRPLNGALMRGILANGAVIGLDALFFALPFKGQYPTAKAALASAWVLYRLLDITLEWGSASNNLVRLNFDPTLGMVRRLAFWTA